MPKNCPVCNSESRKLMDVMVRERYSATMLRCHECEFMFYNDVNWIEDAYEKPINPSDVGYIYRNFHDAEILDRLLKINRFSEKFFLDYGSGYGMFVRLMRDRGYYFHSLDPFCESLFASYTTACPQKFGKYQLVTAFEVFEHLADPVSAMKEIFELGDAVIFTTDLIPEPIPKATSWDYYGFEHGQHIALWTAKSLSAIAVRFGMTYSNLSWISPSWHLIAPVSHALHLSRRLTPRRGERWLAMFKKNNFPRSLMMSDYHRVVAFETAKLKGHESGVLPHLDSDFAVQSAIAGP